MGTWYICGWAWHIGSGHGVLGDGTGALGLTGGSIQRSGRQIDTDIEQSHQVLNSLFCVSWCASGMERPCGCLGGQSAHLLSDRLESLDSRLG